MLRILSTPQEERMVDQVLMISAGRLLRNHHFANVILTGEGFNRMSWLEGFQCAICKGQRKLYQEKELFIRGVVEAYRLSESSGITPRLICTSRTTAQISLPVEQYGKERELVLIGAGGSLLTAGSSFRLLPEDRKEPLLAVSTGPYGAAQTLSMPLGFSPAREEKNCYVDRASRFGDECTVSLKPRDARFGEIYPPSNEVLAQGVEL